MAKSKGNGSIHTQQEEESNGDWFDALNPNNMMNNAQRILTSAVNVLEEEIAAGILVAKKLEKKVIDVDEVRENPEELMGRIRRDTHEAVDIFLDALTAITNHLGILTNSIKKETETAAPVTTPSANGKDHAVSVIVNDTPVKAGETAELRMAVANDSPKDTRTVSLMKTDLTGPQMQKIPGSQIQVLPLALALNPAEQKEVTIRIKVPKTCKPGHYCALFMDANDAGIRAVIGIDVI